MVKDNYKQISIEVVDDNNYPKITKEIYVKAYVTRYGFIYPFIDKQEIGRATYRERDINNNNWELRSFGVDKQYQKQRIGTNIIKCFEETYKPDILGVSSVVEAEQFYAKQGFRKAFRNISVLNRQPNQNEWDKQGGWMEKRYTKVTI